MNDMKHEDYETKQIKVKEQRYATSVVINKAKQYTKEDDMKRREYEMKPNNIKNRMI